MSMNVIIIGAGPVGLTMAAELTRHGLACRIIDKNAQPSATPKALVVWSRTLEILDDMGAVTSFLDAGFPITHANIYSNQRRLLHVSLNGLATPYSYGLIAK